MNLSERRSRQLIGHASGQVTPVEDAEDGVMNSQRLINTDVILVDGLRTFRVLKVIVGETDKVVKA